MAMKHIAVLGSGGVGDALANGFLGHGYKVTRGSRDAGKLTDWAKKAGSSAAAATFRDAAMAGDAVVLAVKGSAATSVIELCGADNLAGKVVMDTTNPIADAAPEKGVIKYFTDINESLMERLQRAAPKAHFVKVFSCVGSALMVGPDLHGVKPTMFICGNDDGAKKEVKGILEQFGWEFEDMGAVEAARAIEPLAMLWCIPGFLHNQWNHAFKLLKP
jgi:predicted dinucleotide-binding enzyme